MPNVSIMISAQDNYSNAIKKISTTTKAFNKDLEGAQNKLDSINKSKATFKVDVDKAKRELKAAQKAFETTGSAADKMKLIDKQMSFDNATQSMQQLRKAANETSREISNLSSTSSKADNRASSLKGAGFLGGNSLIGFAGAAGMAQMATSTGQNALNYVVGSKYGEERGNVASQAIGGAINGAALGFAIGGPVGAAVVGAISAGVGAINGGIENAQKRDDNFKTVVQDSYQQSQQTQADTLQSGSTIASSRETSLQSFTTMFKDADVAKGFMNEMKDFANVTPFLFDDLTGMAKTLKTYNYSVDELKPTMQKIGDAGAALGMDQSNMSMVATAMGRMRSTGKTSTEYLNLLVERGIPAVGYLAKSLGKSEGEVNDMVSKGLIPGAKAAQIIADSMGENFAGSMERQSKTFQGLSSTLQGMNDEMSNAMGEGYNEERKIGMVAEIEFKQGDGGAQMMDANKMIGQFKGSLENAKAQIQMDMQSAVMNGISVDKYGAEVQARLAEMSTKFKELSKSGKAEDGAEMGALLAEAQVMAQNEYMASDGAQLEIASQKSLIQNIRNDTAIKSEYYDTGRVFALEFTKGFESVAAINVSKFVTSGLDQNDPYQRDNINAKPYWLETQPPSKGNSNPVITRAAGTSHAYGFARVPYNDYPARLHEGEQVLTAAEARSRKSGGTNVNISGTYHVREESDIEKIAQSLLVKLRQAQAVS